jgi:hypothetical protein
LANGLEHRKVSKMPKYARTVPMPCFGDEDPPVPPANEPPANPPAFDPKNLSPELQSFLDKERKQASKTARENALKDARTDPTIVSEIQTRLEEEAKMGAEERVAKERSQLEQDRAAVAFERNSLHAQSKLVGEGVDKANAEALAQVLTSSDPKVTDANVDAFLTTYKASVDTRVAAAKAELLGNGGAPPQGGDVETGTEAQYREQYAAAEKAGNEVQMIAVQRRAQAAGIKL